LGAPEVLLNPATASDVSDRVAGLAASGRRVVLLARSDRAARAPDLLAHVDPVALVSLEEGIRPDSADAVRYFKTQNVDLKVMSGDNAVTVAAVAREVGIPRAETPVDARLLPALDADWEPIVEERAVFGRVTPSQKRAFVGALQRRNHVVAMTGDGVNDALALKDADVGVAMGSGAPATRAVAQLVLLDSRFAHVPQVVAEGRRVIANIERVANLFLIKNVYAALLALVVIVIGLPYPFLPRQLTVVSTLTIGIPAFVLSLAPNETRYRPGFLGRVVRFSVPAGVITAIGVMTTYALARAQHRTPVEARAAATVVAMIVGLRVLLLVARPLRPWKVALVLTMGAAFALIMVVPALRDAFKLNLPASMLAQSLLIGALAALALGLADRGLRQDESGTGNVAQS
jgi:cation-transporting ATPase E